MQVPSQRRGWSVPRAATLALSTMAVTAATLGAGFAPVAAYAQQGGSGAAAVATPEPVITLELRDARLENAIVALSTRVNRADFNFSFDKIPGKSFSLVNVKLNDMPLSKAISAIASSAGAVLTLEDGIYHFRPMTDADLVKPAPAAPAVAVSTPAPAAEQASSVRERHLISIPLNYIVPTDLVKTLGDPMYLSMVQGTAPAALKPPTPDTSSVVNPVNLAPPASVGGPGSSAPTAAPATIPAGNPGGTGGTGATAGRDSGYALQGAQGFGRGFGGGNGQFGANGQVGGPDAGGQGGPGGNGRAGQANLRSSIPGITNLISNDSDNALIVEYDNVEDLNRLREIIRLLDIKPKQVQIKAEFIAVNVDDADSFGIDWHFSPAANIDAQIPAVSQSGAASLIMAYATGNTVANLRAALTQSTSNVLQAPIISTVNNREAEIEVQTVVSIAQTYVVPTGIGTSATGTYQVPVTASNGLVVLPHINGDNSISMTLRPQLQSVTLRADGGYDATSDFLTTSRIVQNGETMVLGGFITKNQSQTYQKVPLLSDLPILGSLFTQRSNSTTGTETLVFITPTIIEDQSQGVVGTGGGAPAPTP